MMKYELALLLGILLEIYLTYPKSLKDMWVSLGYVCSPINFAFMLGDICLQS